MRAILLAVAGLAALALAGCNDSDGQSAGSLLSAPADQPSREIVAALAMSEGQPQGQPAASAPTMRRSPSAIGRRTARNGRRALRRRARPTTPSGQAAR